MSDFCQLECARLGIDELLTEVVSWIEPGTKRLGSFPGPLVKSQNCLFTGLQAVVGDCQNSREDFGFVRIKNLNDIPIGQRVEQLEHVGSRWQDDSGEFYWLAERYDCFLVPLIRRSRQDH